MKSLKEKAEMYTIGRTILFIVYSMLDDYMQNFKEIFFKDSN